MGIYTQIFIAETAVFVKVLITQILKLTIEMSLQWQLIAGVLYVEIAITAILLLPFITPQTWRKIFKSKLSNVLERHLRGKFYILVGILVISFLDAIRQANNHRNDAHGSNHELDHLDVKLQSQMILFRAQRNEYICGFALFLCLVIKRMINLLSANASLEIEKETVILQAKSSSEALEKLTKELKGVKATNETKTSGEASKGNDKTKEALISQTTSSSEAFGNLAKESKGTKTTNETKTSDDVSKSNDETNKLKKQLL